MHDIPFSYRSKEQLIFGKDCHYYMSLPVLRNAENYLNENVRFLIDTGAYITVINIATSSMLGFDDLSSIVDSFPLTGFAGSCNASLKEIPGIVIGGRMLKGVKVAIPHEETKHNILGLNVLEHFNYLVDSENSIMYFNDNSEYKMPKELMSSAVMSVSNT